MKDIDQLIVARQHTLRESLKKLDLSGRSILLLVDVDGVLIRTITDGDIRRLLLEGRELEDTLQHLAERQSVIVDVNSTAEDVLLLMNTHNVNQIPIVDEENRPVGLHLRQDIQPRIQLSIPHLGEHERGYVEEAFATNWIAPLGPNVDGFEKELADHVGSQHAAALSSGTAAIHLALRLLDVGVGDLVLCSSFTFVASANPILYQGAEPVFIDSEPATWNMSPLALEAALKECCEKRMKPKAIIVVHLYGQSAEMEKIMALSERYDVPVVEDAAESLGASYRGRPTGTFGKFGVFSFNGNKIITTSGGGMLVSDDGDLIERARFLSTQARDPAPHYEHSEVGYNYRMSNVLAGIGRGQLKVLEERVLSRREVFFRYRDGLSDLKCLQWMPEPEDDFSNRWLSVVCIRPEETTVTPGELIGALANLNIEARPVWKPMHLQPLFKGASYFKHSDGKSFSDYLFETSICLPSASSMTIEEQNSVIKCISDKLK